MAHEAVNHNESVESTVDYAPDDTELEATSVETATNPAGGSVDPQPAAPTTAATTEMVVEVNEPEAGLELFASEPAPDGDDPPDDEDLRATGAEDGAGATGAKG